MLFRNNRCTMPFSTMGEWKYNLFIKRQWKYDPFGSRISLLKDKESRTSLFLEDNGERISLIFRKILIFPLKHNVIAK